MNENGTSEDLAQIEHRHEQAKRTFRQAQALYGPHSPEAHEAIDEYRAALRKVVAFYVQRSRNERSAEVQS